MNLPKFAVENSVFTHFLSYVLVLAGIAAYFVLGQLEDPNFTVKSVVVTTNYPGAGPEEVEQEVTEPLEISLQQMEQVKWIESMSRAGQSFIKVEMKGHYQSHEMPQIFDEVRRKVGDAVRFLPPGAEEPVVNDDVGKIFGFVLGMVGDGFSARELKDYAKDVQRELGLVDGVARVDLWGVQQEVIYVDYAQSQVSELGISSENLLNTLSKQNMVVPAGGIDLGADRFRLEVTGAFSTPEEIEELTIRANAIDRLGQEKGESADALVRLKDFATVRRGYREPPFTLMRLNGQPALAVAIAPQSSVNVVSVGRRIDQRVEELSKMLPVGIEFYKIAWQSDIVDESIVNFMVSLVQAVLIVLVVLWLAMGRQNAIIVGTALIMTILLSFVVMALVGIDLQRMSLGALVIALGMMVDNAIVVADGAYVRIQAGMEKTKAAIEASAGPAMPLLGATLIAISFFFPIYISTESTGEYCASLFQVVAISLIASWVISVTLTPLQCAAMIERESQDEARDPYSGGLFKVFRNLLVLCLRLRWLTLAGMVLALISSILLFPYVPKMFFPDASRTQFMVDYWPPEGTRIQEVSENIQKLERHLQKDQRVKEVVSFIGAGPPRFYLPVEPERPYQSYGHLLVNLNNLADLGPVTKSFQKWALDNIPEAMVRVRKYAVGPGVAFKFEARISGPGSVDTEELRYWGEQGADILRKNPLAKDVRTNWRERVKKLVANYDQSRGRWTSINRGNVGHALQRSHDGSIVGLYREGDELIPVVVRAEKSEREALSHLPLTQVTPNLVSSAVPLAQVADLNIETEEPLIWRRDRRRTITVQAEPNGGTLDELRAAVVPDFEKLELPPGYQLEWGGEFESSRDSQQSLLPGLLPVLIFVAVILVALFGAYRPPLVILAVIPFAVIGLSYGLLLSRVPFGFMALLGAMSLAGMMIKNAVVLLDEVNLELAAGKTQYDAVIAAALSRLRPVCLAAATTVLGVVPLLKDVFWVSMAVVIMGGLLVGTLLTMVMVPVFYAIFFNVQEPERLKDEEASSV